MNTVATIPNKATSVLVRLGSKFGVDPDKMLTTLKATAFKGDATTEQMMALCVVAEAHNLNPWTKEIYAFPSRNGIVPIVGVDGWARIINEHPQFDGMEFEYGPLNDRQLPESITCRMFRKDRGHAIAVTEYLVECENAKNIPWQTHPRRMLRHKAMIQAARVAFGFAGIYDDDEGQRIVEAIDVTPRGIDPRGDMSEVDHDLRDRHVSAIADILNSDKDEAGISTDLNGYVAEHLQAFNDLYISVLDKLASDKIISKANWKKYLAIASNPRDSH